MQAPQSYHMRTGAAERIVGLPRGRIRPLAPNFHPVSLRYTSFSLRNLLRVMSGRV